MRLLASGLIIFSCGIMGLIAATSYSQRVRNLRQLISFVQLLDTEIHFSRTTLPDFIYKHKTQFTGAMQQFLISLNNDLETGTGDHFSVVWERSTLSLKENGLPNHVLEDLQDLGNILGNSDVTEQTKHLKLLLSRLEQALEEAKKEQEKGTRLWQYLGFSTGLLIVLLLF